jgi:hypothetical protein
MTAIRIIPGDPGVWIGRPRPASTPLSQAIDKGGYIQPAMDDPSIANKKAYWESNGQITRHIRVT